jgi:hypothetical protein
MKNKGRILKAYEKISNEELKNIRKLSIKKAVKLTEKLLKAEDNVWK